MFEKVSWNYLEFTIPNIFEYTLFLGGRERTLVYKKEKYFVRETVIMDSGKDITFLVDGEICQCRDHVLKWRDLDVFVKHGLTVQPGITITPILVYQCLDVTVSLFKHYFGLNPRSLQDLCAGTIQFSTLNKALLQSEIVVESEETIKVHRKLANILGFIDKVEFANVGNTPSLPRAYAGDVVPDINLLTFILYIYSDIVYPTRVGNTIVPILGIIHCDSRLDSQYTHRTLPILNYIPVIGNVLSKIELKITDTTGDLIHFQFGKVIIRLSLFQPD